MHSTRSIDPAFADALEAQRRGLVGSELQATYPSAERVARVRTFWGDEMEVVVPELVSCELDRYGLIEPGLTRLFVDHVSSGMVVFDVGAHLGYYTLLASYLGADVHAFEPSATTFQRLQRNAGGRAVLVPRGVWSEEGSLTLRGFGEDHSAVASFFAPKDESLDAPQTTTEVDVVTIDAYVDSTGVVPDLIKVDAEGSEENVLRGARTTIERRRPMITIEVGDAPGTPRSKDVVELALTLGYEIAELMPTGRAPHTRRETYEYGNLALIPPS